MRVSALIPAAGSGERLGRGCNKTFVPIAGAPMLAHTLSVFESCDTVDEVILVVGKREIGAAGEIVGRFGFGKVSDIVEGGSHRQDSVRNGLARARGDIIAIHDGARPLVTREIIEGSLEAARVHGGCVAAVPVIDTIKSISTDGVVNETLERRGLYAIQTPQAFRAGLIRWAYDRAYADGVYATDDAALVERLGEKVVVAPGSYENIKITTPADLQTASAKLGGPEVRTGIGYDVHAFAQGRRMVLGGVDIDFDRGLAGHSDADVVIHAIADACLGAAAMGDIGRHFPDTDPHYEGIRSTVLLERVAEMIGREGWRASSVDSVVICECPRIAPHAGEMALKIAGCLSIGSDRVSVKGTTTEGLGFTGRGEGIACQAIVTIARP